MGEGHKQKLLSSSLGAQDTGGASGSFQMPLEDHRRCPESDLPRPHLCQLQRRTAGLLPSTGTAPGAEQSKDLRWCLGLLSILS